MASRSMPRATAASPHVVEGSHAGVEDEHPSRCADRLLDVEALLRRREDRLVVRGLDEVDVARTEGGQPLLLVVDRAHLDPVEVGQGPSLVVGRPVPGVLLQHEGFGAGEREGAGAHRLGAVVGPVLEMGGHDRLRRHDEGVGTGEEGQEGRVGRGQVERPWSGRVRRPRRWPPPVVRRRTGRRGPSGT